MPSISIHKHFKGMQSGKSIGAGGTVMQIGMGWPFFGIVPQVLGAGAAGQAVG